MGVETTWAERVAGWKASGLSSKEYCEGKGFTDGGLRHWAYRLRQTKPRQPKAEQIRMARVIRMPAKREREAATAAPPARVPEKAATPPSAAPSDGLVLEVGSARIAVRPGFDARTLRAVLDVLCERGTGK